MKSDETRDAALAKMAAFKIKLGFPDEWIDYSTFTPLSTDSFVECGCKATAFLIERELKEMNAPTDRVKWLMTPQTINAYYHPSLNEIVFPAAILQPPFFNPEADAAVNYGAMGAIVGHEMTVCVCVCVCACVCVCVCVCVRACGCVTVTACCLLVKENAALCRRSLRAPARRLQHCHHVPAASSRPMVS